MRKLIATVREVIKLPIVSIKLNGKEAEGKRLYDAFTKRHSRIPVIRQKTIGVELIKLNDFKNAEEFTASVNGKNSAAYFSRKAQRGGYTFAPIDPNLFIDEIFAVNNSAGSRQGREMDASYKKKMEDYPINPNNAYFGIFKGIELVAYLWVVKSGELALLNRLLGHADHLNNGVMYMMITGYVEREIQEKSKVKFVMYDTFFGAGEGLKMFKSRCGFKPYRVKWIKS